LDVLRIVAGEDLRAQRGQPPRGGAVAQVAARDAKALVEQHLGDAAHARAADADEMDVANGVFHALLTFASSMQAPTTASTASVLATLRAFSAMASNCARSSPWSSTASLSGVSPAWASSQAAPASTRKRALCVWWSSTAAGNGTSSEAAPTAASSVTVLAPARPITRSAWA